MKIVQKIRKTLRKAKLNVGIGVVMLSIAIMPKRIITKITAVLNIKKLHKIEVFSAKAKLIRQSVNGNSWFPACPVNVANGGTLDLAIQALDAVQIKTLTKVKGAAQDRDVKYKIVLDYLHQVMAYVQLVGNANAASAEAIITSSGFDVKHLGIVGKDAITVKPKKGESGTMIVKVKKIAGTVANLWEYSLDGGKTWVGMDATAKGTTEITGLKPGSSIIVNHRPVLRKSKGTWI